MNNFSSENFNLQSYNLIYKGAKLMGTVGAPAPTVILPRPEIYTTY